MVARWPAMIPLDLALQMILEGGDEEPFGGINSESDISDVEEPDYCPPTEQDQSKRSPLINLLKSLWYNMIYIAVVNAYFYFSGLNTLNFTHTSQMDDQTSSQSSERSL